MAPGRGRRARTGGRGWAGCACPPERCPATCGFSGERLLTTGSPPVRKCCPTPSTLLPTPTARKAVRSNIIARNMGPMSTEEMLEPPAHAIRKLREPAQLQGDGSRRRCGSRRRVSNRFSGEALPRSRPRRAFARQEALLLSIAERLCRTSAVFAVKKKTPSLASALYSPP